MANAGPKLDSNIGNATAIDINGTCDVSGAFTTTTITASGIVKTDDTTEATSTTDGSLQTDGGLSVAKDAVFGDDVKLLSDAAVLGFGADGDVIDIDAKKGTINVRLSKKELSNRKRKWKPKKINFGNGTLWKYAQTVGPAYLGAPTHPGGKKEVKCYADI